MIRKIWQTILNLWRQIRQYFDKKPAPPPPAPTPIRTFGDYEQKFMELLEGVEQGWGLSTIQFFLIGSKIKNAELEKWLQEFGERLLVSPETNLELGRRLVRLGAANYGRISEVAGNIGRQLLTRKTLTPIPIKEPSVITKSSASIREKNTQDTTIELIWTSLKEIKEKDSEGLEQTIASYKKALKIDDMDTLAWTGLGMTLLHLGFHHEAIVAHKQVLKIEPNSHYALNRLGFSLSKLGRYREAIKAYTKALEINPIYDLAWMGLMNAINSFGSYREAIETYMKILEINPIFLNHDGLWNELINAINSLSSYREQIEEYDKLLELAGDKNWLDRENQWSRFFNSTRNLPAFQVSDEGLLKYMSSNYNYRLACGRLHRQKGWVHYEQGRRTATYFESFHKAKASYEQAREFFKSPLIPEDYLAVLQELFTVCRSLGDPKASEYLTEANILLGNLISENDIDPEIKLRLQRKFAKLYQLEVDKLVQSGDQVNALEKAEFRKNLCLQWMRAGSPNRTDSPTYYQIRDLLANNTATAIIYWHLSPVSLTAFIITPDNFQTITTPVTDLFPNPNIPSLENWLKDWKTNYQNYCQTSKDQSKESHPWRQSMTAQLQKLADILKIPEICTHLTNIQHLILIPHRDLHLLPLDALFQPPFAALLQDTEREQIRTISRLPSAQIAILQQQQNPTETGPNSLLMVEHSQGKSALKYTEIEAAAISQFYPTQRPANAATKTAIIQALQANQGIFHYTGHAYHNTEKSEASALILASGEELTLTDILQLNFVNYYLICLSACETGFTKTGELIDEFVGIASGFLPETNYIISTLWRVDERSSALLMIYFYQLWKQGIQPPFALQQAKDWLRELTNGKLGEWYAGELLPLLREANFKSIFFFEMEASRLQENLAKIEEKPYNHPYHWAAFTITGNG